MAETILPAVPILIQCDLSIKVVNVALSYVFEVVWLQEVNQFD